jgi:pyridoxamine 5'-phosphate oxidase|tara:strand:- start:1021 stop:1647 length:627 start_codon:yes stop_codon:yes gene_type:complete
MNQKNPLGLNNCFLDLEDPIQLFKVWMDEAKKMEPNDPNALSLATSNKNNFPSVRMVLLKDFSQNGFVFYTNLNSQKGNDLRENPKAAMCFHWKSLLRQVRINGRVTQVADEDADQYFNSRAYVSRIGAWASNQSEELTNRSQLINSIQEYKNKYSDEKKVPRPSHWSGWNLSPLSIEFWLDGDNRIHERLKYIKNSSGQWNKSLLSP